MLVDQLPEGWVVAGGAGEGGSVDEGGLVAAQHREVGAEAEALVADAHTQRPVARAVQRALLQGGRQ